MIRFWFVLIIVTIIQLSAAQSIKSVLIGKTYERWFYAAVFKHHASYTFYKDKIRYSVNGFFINESYIIEGDYFNDGFKGHNPISGESYILHIKILSPTKIRINKQGVDPKYQRILKDKPVGRWYDYYLKKK